MIAGEMVAALAAMVLFWIALYVVGWICVLVMEQGIYFCQGAADIYRGGRKWLKQWGI